MNLTMRVDVDAAPETVFAAATDWERQGEWMLGTTVRACRGDGRSVGSTLEAVTGIRGIGVTDRMEITVWDAPARCEMRHLGRVVRGIGIFAVQPRGRDAATFEWTEQLGEAYLADPAAVMDAVQTREWGRIGHRFVEVAQVRQY